ncbi:MAG TPA: GAF domain-containing protein [Methylomirabilota bacterium]|nr:GAF domain-containing protein [Methylomirabilota bacterium]
MDSESILVVDDDRAVASSVREYLTQEGHTVALAHSGHDGLTRLRDGAIALVLVDLRLPDMDGIELMQAARRLPDPPEIVVITGYATITSAVQAMEGGIAGYLEKPFQMPRLAAVVQRVLERRRLVRENMQLQAETASRLRELEVMLSISRTASATLDVQEALRRICRELVFLVGADTGAAYLLDEPSGRLVPTAGYHVPKAMMDAFLSHPVPFGDPGFLHAIRESRRPVYSDDVPSDPRFGFEIFRRFRHQSGLVLPLLLDDTVAGAFYFVWWKARKHFTPRELELAENVAAQVTMVLRHARLLERADRQWRRLQVLCELSRAIAATNDADQVLTRLVNEAMGLLGVEAAGLRLLEGEHLVVKARTDSAAPLMSRPRVARTDGLSGAVLTGGRPVAIADMAEDGRIDAIDRDGAREHGFHAGLGVPLQIHGEVVGSLSVYARVRRKFSPEDVALLSALADQAALAIHKAAPTARRRGSR